MSIHLVIMGVCGCGKTTLATALAGLLGWDFIEADDVHPAANVAKMRAGIPLNDDDRRPWLESLRAQMSARAAAGRNTLVSCSALKRSYRDILAAATGEVHFLHLDGSQAVIAERLAARQGHFMPPTLLPSQLATLEHLQDDEQGIGLRVADSPAAQIDAALHYLATQCHISPPALDAILLGAGVMGAALAQNFAANGVRLGVYDQDFAKAFRTVRAADVPSGQLVVSNDLARLSDMARAPRVFFLVVPAQAIETALRSIAAADGDIIVDLGNSHFADTRKREQWYAVHGQHFVGCGISGGEAGARHGAALMCGGSPEAFAVLQPLLQVVAAKAPDGEPCLVHVGRDGAGHYVKMIHNGIEYADMALLAEAYALCRANGMKPADVAALCAEWQTGELQSYLVSITGDILTARDTRTGAAMVDVIADRAGQKGTGMWASRDALALGVPANMTAEATLMRALSSCDTARLAAQKTFSAPEITPYAGDLAADLGAALLTGKILAYAQGFLQIQYAAKAYDWNIDLAQVARGWRAGCIIRAALLQPIAAAYQQNPELPFLGADPYFADCLTAKLPATRRIVAWAVSNGISTPTLSAGVAFFDALRNSNLATALIQAQRDYFGAHSYARRDEVGHFHRLWTGDGSEQRLD